MSSTGGYTVKDLRMLHEATTRPKPWREGPRSNAEEALLGTVPSVLNKLEAAEVLARAVEHALRQFGDDYPGRLNPVSEALDAFMEAELR